MESVAVLHPHLLIWRDPPVWPFVWRGLLPLLALALAASFALGPVARNWIEGTVRRATRAQLDAASFGWVGLSVSGQNVTLSGEEPAAGAGERAIALAKGATCATWIGHHTCAARGRGRVTAPAPPGQPRHRQPRRPVSARWRARWPASRSSLPAAVPRSTHAAARFSIDSRKKPEPVRARCASKAIPIPSGARRSIAA